MTSLPRNIIEAIASPDFLGSAFRDLSTWRAWLVFLKALFALGLDDDELAIFRKHTGRADAASRPFRVAWLCVGRRGGKSRIIAAIAVFLALFRDYAPYLAPGEKAHILVIAADRSQAQRVLGYIGGMLDPKCCPILAEEVDRAVAGGFEVGGNVVIEVATASFRSTRGSTIAAAICDEIAFWRIEDTSANPADEILRALKPGMLSIPNSMMLCSSSPYAKKGPLWEAYRKHFGVNDAPELVWQGATLDMNPSVPAEEIERELAEDYDANSAEYLALFREGLAAFVSREAVEACVAEGVAERAPEKGISYSAFTDAAGGSGQDSFTLSIGHKEDTRAVVDLVCEVKPPFNPARVVADMAEILKSYGLSSVVGDRYAAGFNVELWRGQGIAYQQAEKTASELYKDLLPAINSRSLILLDSKRAVGQICGLERRTGTSGRDQITHPTRGHDDIANAIAGVVSILTAQAEAPQAVIGTYAPVHLRGVTSNLVGTYGHG